MIFLLLAALLWYCPTHVLYSPTQRGRKLVLILGALGQNGLDEKKIEKNAGVEYDIWVVFVRIEIKPLAKPPLYSTVSTHDGGAIIHKLLQKVDEISACTKENLEVSSEI